MPHTFGSLLLMSANLLVVFLNRKPKTGSKLSVPLVLSRGEKWLVSVSWLYFYSSGPWEHCEPQLSLPRLNFIVIILPLVWKCVLFIKICNIPVDTVLRIFWPNFCHSLVNPPHLMLCLNFHVLFTFSKEFYPPDCWQSYSIIEAFPFMIDTQYLSTHY